MKSKQNTVPNEAFCWGHPAPHCFQVFPLAAHLIQIICKLTMTGWFELGVLEPWNIQNMQVRGLPVLDWKTLYHRNKITIFKRKFEYGCSAKEHSCCLLLCLCVKQPLIVQHDHNVLLEAKNVGKDPRDAGWTSYTYSGTVLSELET